MSRALARGPMPVAYEQRSASIIYTSWLQDLCMWLLSQLRTYRESCTSAVHFACLLYIDLKMCKVLLSRSFPQYQVVGPTSMVLSTGVQRRGRILLCCQTSVRGLLVISLVLQKLLQARIYTPYVCRLQDLCNYGTVRVQAYGQPTGISGIMQPQGRRRYLVLTWYQVATVQQATCFSTVICKVVGDRVKKQ